MKPIVPTQSNQQSSNAMVASLAPPNQHGSDGQHRISAVQPTRSWLSLGNINPFNSSLSNRATTLMFGGLLFISQQACSFAQDMNRTMAWMTNATTDPYMDMNYTEVMNYTEIMNYTEVMDSTMPPASGGDSYIGILFPLSIIAAEVVAIAACYKCAASAKQEQPSLENLLSSHRNDTERNR